MIDNYANIKTIFFSEALMDSVAKSNLKYRFELKHTVNKLKKLYNKEITKDMLRMYENHEEAFDKISNYTEKIGKEFSKTDLTKYGQLLELLEKFNNGTLFKNQTNE